MRVQLQEQLFQMSKSDPTLPLQIKCVIYFPWIGLDSKHKWRSWAQGRETFSNSI